MPVKILNSDYISGVVRQIDCFGDSLTQGAGGDPYPKLLGNLLHPRLVNNFGMGGQTMDQIASRQGGKPVFVTIAGNAFNGTNEVSITDISSQLLSNSSPATEYISGIIAGVRCRINRIVVSGVETYTITPGSGSNGEVPANSIFYPDQGYNSKKAIQIFWVGRNNVPNLSELPGLIDSCVYKIDNPRRFVIVGVLNSLTEITGTNNYNAIREVNSVLLANYPNNYVDSSPPTTIEMQKMRFVPSELDIANIQNNTIPDSMRSDNIHLNGLGYKLIADRVYSVFRKYDW